MAINVLDTKSALGMIKACRGTGMIMSALNGATTDEGLEELICLASMSCTC